MRTIAIGLDGCSWNVLGPLLDTGELPELDAIRRSGASGVLESTIPFFTGAAWASYATGSSPAAHGIYDFMMLREGGRLSVAKQHDLRRSTYFEQLARDGKRSVLVNLPIDLYRCDGSVIVNSWLTDDPERALLPAERRPKYSEALASYQTFPVDPRDVDELCRLEESRFTLARELFLGEAWDHFFVLFSGTDWLGHAKTGAFLAGDDSAHDAFVRFYRQLDGYIGWFREQAPDALVVVLSDHGQCAEEAVVRVNNVLERLGFATRPDSGKTGESPFFVDRRPKPQMIAVPARLSRYRRNRFIRPAALLAKRVLKKTVGLQVNAASAAVDRSDSRAFTPTDSAFAIYGKDLDESELDVIRQGLLELRLSDGRQAIEGIWTPEELYGRRRRDDDPLLLFSPALGARPSARLKQPDVEDEPIPGRGCHQRDGIVLLAGPGVADDVDLGRASIYDLAPTLLWAGEAGIPTDLDGRVLFEAFEPAIAEARPVVEVEALAPEELEAELPDSEAVTSRLRALGYI
jgi:predicted AlkP superfamily phosphohydrolase/phosphomutase